MTKCRKQLAPKKKKKKEKKNKEESDLFPVTPPITPTKEEEKEDGDIFEKDTSKLPSNPVFYDDK